MGGGRDSAGSFRAWQARRSASLRVAAARSAEARTEGLKMLSRDLISMPEECASLAGIGKPLKLGFALDMNHQIGRAAPSFSLGIQNSARG